MKFALAVLPVVLVCLAMPASLRAEDPANTMVSTNWSLEKAKKAQPRRPAGQRTANAAQAPRHTTAKPRVFGGATVTNQGNRNQGKARAKVGVALPF